MIVKVHLSSIVLVIAAPVIARTAPPESIELPVDGTVPIEMNGRSLRVAVIGTGNGYLTLNPDTASALALKPSASKITGYIGPVRISGQSAKASFSIAGSTKRTAQVRWFERALSLSSDGAVGPAVLPQDRVVFRFRPSVPGDVVSTIPLTTSKDSFGTLGSYTTIDGRQIDVNFDFLRETSLVTASTGALVASDNRGSFSGPSSETDIRMGVKRPVRPMKLSNPLAIGPLRITTLEVRVSDGGSTNGIADPAAEDSAEIVVTGTKGRKPVSYILVGRAAMQNCASVTFDKRAKMIIFECVRS